MSLLVFFLASIFGAYFLGVKMSAPEQSAEVTAPKNLQEIAVLDSEFDRQQRDLTNRIDEIKNRVATAKLNLNVDKLDDQVQSTEISDSLKELNDRILESRTSPATTNVAFPPDSAAGKLQRQPMAESGVPVSVLRNYEKETGVSAEEVEALMRRTE